MTDMYQQNDCIHQRSQMARVVAQKICYADAQV